MSNTAAILTAAIIAVESGNNPAAYNAKENAVGPAQIRQAALDDVNRVWGTHYTLADMRDSWRSRQAIKTYARIYGARTPEQIARTWNGGPNGARKRATAGYWKRVKAQMRRKSR